MVDIVDLTSDVEEEGGESIRLPARARLKEFQPAPIRSPSSSKRKELTDPQTPRSAKSKFRSNINDNERMSSQRKLTSYFLTPTRHSTSSQCERAGYSSDKNTPLGLREKVDAEPNFERIDSSLESPLSRRKAVGPLLGESLPFPMTSTFEGPKAHRGTTVPSKRAGPGDHNPKPSMPASLPVVGSQAPQQQECLRSTSSVMERSSDMGSGRSLTPRMPGPRKSNPKPGSLVSSPRPQLISCPMEVKGHTPTDHEVLRLSESTSPDKILHSNAQVYNIPAAAPYSTSLTLDQQYGASYQDDVNEIPSISTDSSSGKKLDFLPSAYVEQPAVGRTIPPPKAQPKQRTSLPQPEPSTQQSAHYPQTQGTPASVFSTHFSEDGVDMEFDPVDTTPFPTDFDRGRFPKERRRRGGKKYGTSRVGAFTKNQSVDFPHRASGRPGLSNPVNVVGSTARSSSPKTFKQDPTYLPKHHKGPPGLLGNPSRERNAPIPTMLDACPTDEKAGSQILAWSQEDTQRVADFYIAVIAPQIKRLEKRYKHSTNVNLGELRESLSNDVVDDALLAFLRDNEFSTDKPQRKRLRKQIGRMYHRRLKSAQLAKRGLFIKSERGRGGIDFALIPPKGSAQFVVPDDIRSRSPRSTVKSPAGSRLSLKKALIASSRHQSIPHELAPSQAPSCRDSNGRFTDDKILDQRVSPTPNVYRKRGKDIRLGSSTQGRTKAPRFPGFDRAQHIQSKEASQLYNTATYNIAESPRQGTHVFPRTLFDSEMERLIATATLKETTIHGTNPSPDQKVTESDQEQLLATQYVAKTLDHQLGRLTVLQGREIDPAARPRRERSALLRRRELHGGEAGLRNDLRQCVIEKLKPWRKWKGASSDITTVAWAPNSLMFAVGAAAHTNAEDLQYNRPCNLMLGELTSNHMWELPDHRTKRPTPETIAEGYNSSQQTYNTCDPMIYETVTATSFSITGEHLYTASRDHTVKVWDVKGGRRKCIKTLDHAAVVTGLSVSQSPRVSVFATACQSIESAIRVFYWSNNEVDSDPQTFSSSAALDKPTMRILPECLSWGPTTQNHHLLLAGFAEWNIAEGEWAKRGQLCLWDIDAGHSLKVTPGSSSVTAVTWHPFQSIFAAGGAPGANLRLKRQVTKSVVRTYDPRILTRFAMEYESPAQDIQDISFHPLDGNIVTAGCTDGRSFVWDYRWPDKPLHILSHGEAVMELDQDRDRAATDTGVCLSLWGSEGSLYYTGSSDGVVKAWDVRRHPIDVHVKDVAHVGAAIQNGAFSPNFSHLLVGDADGAIHVLSSAPCGPSLGDDPDGGWDTEETIQLIRAPDGSGKRVSADDDQAGTEGIEEAARLVNTGQLTIHPIFGPGQGPKYRGPFATDRRIVHEDGSLGRLKTEIEGLQIYDSQGNPNLEGVRFRKAHADRRRWEFYDRNATDAARSLMPSTKTQISQASTVSSDIENERLGALDPSFGQSAAAKPYNIIDRHTSRGGINGEAGARHLSQRAAFEAYSKANTALTLFRLAAEAEDVYPATPLRASSPNPPAHKATLQKSMNTFFKTYRSPDKRALQGAVVNKIPESKMLEENHWWPGLGEQEIERALAHSR